MQLQRKLQATVCSLDSENQTSCCKLLSNSLVFRQPSFARLFLKFLQPFLADPYHFLVLKDPSYKSRSFHLTHYVVIQILTVLLELLFSFSKETHFQFNPRAQKVSCSSPQNPTLTRTSRVTCYLLPKQTHWSILYFFD